MLATRISIKSTIFIHQIYSYESPQIEKGAFLFPYSLRRAHINLGKWENLLLGGASCKTLVARNQATLAEGLMGRMTKKIISKGESIFDIKWSVEIKQLNLSSSRLDSIDYLDVE
ncbi:hypothetical protein [Legionella feeleii]|uniref:Uncharacterized protein n=1 Tax=Legionella feeleii TaxID=453 RepID=A0A378IXU3_9GAMM|nr:hypothetical protein [Legionella feeleii]STX39853.1 Uncharacterised protein [Legionella feeleii]